MSNHCPKVVIPEHVSTSAVLILKFIPLDAQGQAFSFSSFINPVPVAKLTQARFTAVGALS